VACKKSPYEYEPKTIHELDHWNNDDPVKTTMTDGTVDLINGDPDPERWLEDRYTPEYPK
jgi:hypothetical protein